jgi:hypothetical protein
MSVEGATTGDEVIELAYGLNVRINILASDETGGLVGLVTDDDSPAPASVVVLASTAAGKDPLRFFATQAATDGRFDFGKVPAGDYVLFAVSDPQVEYANPVTVQPYLVMGTPVRIAAHASATANIRLLTIVGK